MARRGRVRSRRKRSGFGGFFIILLLIAVIAGGVFAYFSPKFEKIKPQIEIAKNLYASSTKPIKIKISDNVAIKSAKVIISSNGKDIPIFAQDFLLPKKEQTIEVKLPKEFLNSSKDLDLFVEARDSSLWGFFQGNRALSQAKVIVDSTPPKIYMVAASISITKGGSALAIVKVDDKALDSVYIDVGNGIKFTPIKYKKDGYFASLYVWPFTQDSFNPKVVAIDKAGNVASYPIRVSKRFRKYRVSKIRATDRFINGKISELASQDSDYANITDKLEKFRAVNELMRKKNEEYIHKLSKSVTPIDYDNWKIKPFHPLKRAKKVADFGDKRYYYYNSPDNIISTSYHLGFDLASIKEDNLYASNSGKVVSDSYNGIYGNMPMIDHGFGLYTLYGHCSSVLVKKGDLVASGAVIGKTGVSGLALGDHTHFGIVVQGVEVLPLDWMDKRWIQKSIFDVFSKANGIIGYNNK
jgi:murein DD-endopeptidase MepM/ murein hydrolase activator NlpD